MKTTTIQLDKPVFFKGNKGDIIHFHGDEWDSSITEGLICIDNAKDEAYTFSIHNVLSTAVTFEE